MGHFWLIILGVLALVIVAAVVSYYRSKRRREAMAAWAASRGMTFSRGERFDFDDRFPDFDCLRRGSRRYAYNVVEGRRDGRPFLAFDYHYETYSTNSKGQRTTNHHYFSAVVLGTPVPFVPLAIRPEGFFDKVGEFFGYDDIDFESAEFSRRFHVTSPDKRWAYDVIHQRTMAFLLSAPTLMMEFAGPWAIGFRSTTFAIGESVNGFEAAAAVIEGVFERLPDYVLRGEAPAHADGGGGG